MTFKEKVIYQVYPKSFYDSNQDGVGDLQGIIEKLPYLKQLGVDMIWLNPIYPSPQHDNGYDISNYTAIDPRFGTMADFEQLVARGAELGIDFMLDMVLNHTSTEHEWFQRALAGDKEYQDYYILRPLKKNGALPTNWESKFGGVAWEPFGDTDLYYLHLYDVTQADLNWRNPKVREELFKVVNFWLDKGVKGFRFDVINVIGKDELLLDDPEGDGKPYYTDKPIVHTYLNEMNQASFGRQEDTITVGEMSSTTVDNCILYTEASRNELTMTFNFHHLKVDYENGQKWSNVPFDFEELKHLMHIWGEDMSAGDGWNALFWNNHDQPRALSRFVDKEYRVAGAKMLAAAIHLNRGTPYIYQGEEIGMIDPEFQTIEEYCDVETLNAFQILQQEGHDEAETMSFIRAKSRDNSRIPMQWADSVNAGFSTSTPWLKVAANYPEINVEKELASGSIFAFYQKLIELRKTLPIIADGDYQSFAPDHPQVFGYERTLENQSLLVLNNFYAAETTVRLPDAYLQGSILIGSYPDATITQELVLRPYETIAIFCK